MFLIHNERTKLTAAWFNTLATALVAAGTFGPFAAQGYGVAGFDNGRGVGILVGILDVLKGFLPAIAFTVWGSHIAGEIAGLAAVVGHITSPFLRGRGGKGVATALGAILGTHAIWAIPVLAAFAVTVGITRRVGLGAVAAAIALIPTALLLSDGWHAWVMALVIAALILLRHQANIRSAVVPPASSDTDTD